MKRIGFALSMGLAAILIMTVVMFLLIAIIHLYQTVFGNGAVFYIIGSGVFCVGAIVGYREYRKLW